MLLYARSARAEPSHSQVNDAKALEIFGGDQAALDSAHAQAIDSGQVRRAPQSLRPAVGPIAARSS